ncbi:MAG TPA: zinc-binding alcohol dehydrogenase family protein [Pseudonocardiaceae bacterium]|nr:zinc-binding alcohol dehydrogenase family protein [Pseudonocardiaceae bacterium]
MRVVQLAEFGPAQNLVLAEEPDPTPGPGQLLVSVAAAGVNRADLLFRSGRYHSGPPLPAVLGSEAAGVVVAVGADVTGFAVGDRVVAWGGIGAPGFYRELALVEPDRAVHVPANVSLQAAAGLPIAWLSAWHCLRALADLRAGETVLIHAAASGVGSAAIQIAKDLGASVIGVVGSAAKQRWITELGADHALNRREADIVAEVDRLTEGRGVDVVLDAVGGEAFAQSLKAVGPGGRVVALANVALAPSTVDTRDFYPKNVRIYGFQLTNLMRSGWDPRPELTELLSAVHDGRFTVSLEQTFTLADAAKAHSLLESGDTQGKVVLAVGNPDQLSR